MPYPVQKYVKELNQFCVASNAFTDDDVERILDLEDLQKFQRGAVGGPTSGGQVNKKTRDSDVMWIHHEANSDWLFQKFSYLVSRVNYDHFMYEIDGFESFQYTVYKSKNKQHYDWHIDSGNTYNKFERKISATIMLTDPNDYEGGEFECIMNGRVDEPFIGKPNKGDVVFFSSWMPHRVRPVTKGTRKSLVCWVMGERTW